MGAGECTFLIGEHPDAAGANGESAFGVGNADGECGGDFVGLEIHAGDGLIAAVRYPETAEASRQAGAWLRAHWNHGGYLVRLSVELGHRVFRLRGDVDDSLAHDLPVGRSRYFEDSFGLQVRDRDLHARGLDTRLRRTLLRGWIFGCLDHQPDTAQHQRDSHSLNLLECHGNPSRRAAWLREEIQV